MSRSMRAPSWREQKRPKNMTYITFGLLRVTHFFVVDNPEIPELARKGYPVTHFPPIVLDKLKEIYSKVDNLSNLLQPCCIYIALSV